MKFLQSFFLTFITLLPFLTFTSCKENVARENPETPLPPVPVGNPGVSLKVVWLKPTDVPMDQEKVNSMTRAVLNVQSFYRELFDGLTFTVDDPVVQVIEGNHNTLWYSQTDPGDPDKNYYTFGNVYNEVQLKTGLSTDYSWVVYTNGTGNGAASYNCTVLTKMDLDGVCGLTENMTRWFGGLGHELSHTMGCPDSQTPSLLSGQFYVYPDCTFLSDEFYQIKNSGYLNQYIGLPFEENKSYHISVPGNNLSMEIRDASTDNEAKVVLNTTGNGEEQGWKLERLGKGLYKIINQKSNKALEVPDNQNNTYLRQNIYNGTDYQKWYILKGDKDNWIIWNLGSLKMATATGQNAGDPIVQDVQMNNTGQRFIIGLFE
jgi:hypothetical protein